MTIQTCLSLHNLKLNVNLGLLDEERETAQTISLDIDIFFLQPPRACETDQLQDTVCYASLAELIKVQLAQKEFHLIEYLCHDIYQIIKTHLQYPAKLRVRLTKYPVIENLSGGATFSYADEL